MEQEKRSFEFVPYKFGCFSFVSYVDHRILIRDGFLDNTEKWKLSTSLSSSISLKPEDSALLSSFSQNYKMLRGHDLIRYVYTRYPYYAINSEIADKYLSEDEQSQVRQSVTTDSNDTLFTIGYEGKSPEGYFNTLIKNNVHLLCDVRRNPISMKYGFSKSQLSRIAGDLGIEYRHIPELGIASEKRKNLYHASDYVSLFDEYAKDLDSKKEYLNRVKSLIKESSRVALTCFESTPGMCHRHKITDSLSSSLLWNIPIIHL
ncbi:MAG: DUF488 domain-containing protein [bacterium]